MRNVTSLRARNQEIPASVNDTEVAILLGEGGWQAPGLQAVGVAFLRDRFALLVVKLPCDGTAFAPQRLALARVRHRSVIVIAAQTQRSPAHKDVATAIDDHRLGVVMAMAGPL